MPAPAAKTLTKPIQTYLATLAELDRAEARTEGNYRRAFGHLLVEAAGATKSGWTLLDELTLKGEAGLIRWDGVLKDALMLNRGYWEAKDSADKLDTEIAKKRDKGYTLVNSIFEDTRTAVLFQDKREVFRADLRQPAQIADLLVLFFGYTEPDIEQFEQAVEEFKQRVPELAQGLLAKIAEGHRDNKRFQAAYADLMRLCRSALDPNITRETVDEMLTQHLLTERLIRTIFDNPDFRTQNVIANEIEKVIGALVSASFSREEYLKGLNRFYAAIEGAAATLTDFADKQAFLNTVYERFFQGYAVDVADTHGIVYTPQPIVDFMCASIVETLGSEFGKSLGDPDVVILDPCTGTGNFIVNLLRRAQPSQRDGLYRQRLFANEIMLLPYYIAALNIEHAYYDLTGRYEPFEGLCFVDTLTLDENLQPRLLTLISEQNTERVERQKKAPITVIVGNPPYNVGQKSENDNNKNRRYKVVDGRIKTTYAKDSAATLKTQLYDPYVKFFRWASDRIGAFDGIVCYVSNNSFVDQLAFDGMRKHLLHDYSRIYHLDLHGNVRQNPKLSGTTHNVFGIQVGVGITLAIKRAADAERRVYYHRVPADWRKTEKLDWLTQQGSTAAVTWKALTPDARHRWLIPAGADDFAALLPLGSKATKGKVTGAEVTIFGTYSGGVKTNRDEVVYDFDRDKLMREIQQFIEDYNAEVDRYKRAKRPENVDGFVRNVIKWDGTLKNDLKRGNYAKFDERRIRKSLYRPFSSRYLYFDSLLINSVYRQPYFFPTPATEAENRMIGLTDLGSEKPFMVMMSNQIVDLHLVGAGSSTQSFPFYVYDEDGTNRRENVSDAALALFRAAHGDAVSKWDIFYYVYAALHDPVWRTTYADALKKDLPRVPVTPPRGTFAAWAAAGRALADLHLGYETVEPHRLGRIEASGVPYATRVEKMRLSKDRTTLTVNESLTLTGIPAAAFEYRLGSRSALEWVIDQYQVTRDKAGVITSDPNRADDPDYIVKLVGRVIAVSLRTQEIIAGL